ncbi:monofunctional biosynthetic peptidoglycan transglycosylase [Comamonas flocculans]|uniref:Biosynthetic peptidoglycan transglycosylase n=1 Tax=Comamonas flocculans TaxID=2597701 RepID=A0A5B8RWN6_9BURK|nr:monofunctional biosynthetic peptidoglycan transglycosylase [Comamonas flocculans]QEA12217.1 monofunctional biosynthetic peptidoglycan transglycosylase [Comamonas flocculans]
MKALTRWLALVLAGLLALQLFFVLRIALMARMAPESTSFQRSALWQQLRGSEPLHWRQQWVAYGQISEQLKRAVLASEDDAFVQHDGVQWSAIEKAWERNALARERAERAKARRPDQPAAAPKIRGGSTITQQLAKNLLLSGERTLVRKGQELVLTFTLEQLLSKRRILEIYLNSVEWGDGIYGAEAAARHYYRKSAAELSAREAARLAVMLPAPRRFEKTPHSAYLAGRTRTILARMPAAQLP